MTHVYGALVTADRKKLIEKFLKYGSDRTTELAEMREEINVIYQTKFKAIPKLELTEHGAKELNKLILTVYAKIVEIEKLAIALRKRASDELEKTPPPSGHILIEKNIAVKGETAVEIIWDNMTSSTIVAFGQMARGIHQSLTASNFDLALECIHDLEASTAIKKLERMRKFFVDSTNSLETIIAAPSTA